MKINRCIPTNILNLTTRNIGYETKWGFITEVAGGNGKRVVVVGGVKEERRTIAEEEGEGIRGGLFRVYLGVIGFYRGCHGGRLGI